jgi:hypothetical protein
MQRAAATVPKKVRLVFKRLKKECIVDERPAYKPAKWLINLGRSS